MTWSGKRYPEGRCPFGGGAVPVETSWVAAE